MDPAEPDFYRYLPGLADNNLYLCDGQQYPATAEDRIFIYRRTGRPHRRGGPVVDAVITIVISPTLEKIGCKTSVKGAFFAT